jgi:D-arabinose 1-dehydrogenase-like Zn-dependent alcohol dehydrogenase
METAAPILCAGVTFYKGLKETDTKPSNTVVISGIGGLRHIAVQGANLVVSRHGGWAERLASRGGGNPSPFAGYNRDQLP